MAGARGLDQDRRFLLLDADGGLLTQRRVPQMALVQPELDGESLVLRHRARPLPPLRLPLAPPDGAVERVVVWDDEVEAVHVPAGDAWLSTALGIPCRLMTLAPDGRRLATKEPLAPLRP